MRRALLFLGIGLSMALGQTSQVQTKQAKPRAATAKPAAAKPAPVKAAPSKPENIPLDSLRVRGNEKLQAEKIILVSGLKIGQAVTEAVFQAARDKLIATGAFESVGYEYQPNSKMNGFNATLEVAETRPLFRYTFEDVPETLRAALLRDEALFGEEIPATRQVLERFTKILNTELAGKTTVEARLTPTTQGEGVIIFRPAGARARIAEVHFTGNKEITNAQLTDVFAAASFGTEFSDAGLRRLLDTAIRPLYEAKGRLRVKFGLITSEPTKQQNVVGVSVTVALDEGAEFKLGTARFMLGGAPIEAKQLKQITNSANFHEGEIANFDQINAGLQSVKEIYTRNGYMHVALKTDREVLDAEQLVNLTITIEPGAQYNFGRLTIRGLDILSEPVIRKMWGPREGKPYDPQFPDSFMKDIRDQAMFDNLGKTEAIVAINEEQKVADVTLDFKGARKPRQDPFAK